MKKYKSVLFLTFMSVLLIVLSGCGETTSMKAVSEPSKETKEEKKEPKIYEDTLEVGTAFYYKYKNEYIYSGLVNESVLITILKDDGTTYSNHIPLYISISRKKAVPLPYASVSMQIKEVNRAEGTIKLTLIQNKK